MAVALWFGCDSATCRNCLGLIRQDDVGHSTVFTAIDGRRLLVIHKCFGQPATRVPIYELEELAGRIRVKRQILGAP